MKVNVEGAGCGGEGLDAAEPEGCSLGDLNELGGGLCNPCWE
jgi:hypothetical protein